MSIPEFTAAKQSEHDSLPVNSPIDETIFKDEDKGEGDSMDDNERDASMEKESSIASSAPSIKQIE